MEKVRMVDSQSRPSGFIGSYTYPVVAGTSDQQVSTSKGAVNRAVVTTAGGASATPGCIIYDSSTNDTSGKTILGVIPGNQAVGQAIEIMMPVTQGIFVKNVASGPVFTLSYDK